MSCTRISIPVPALKLRGAAAIAAKLLVHKEAAYFARRLTGIYCDVPLECIGG